MRRPNKEREQGASMLCAILGALLNKGTPLVTLKGIRTPRNRAWVRWEGTCEGGYHTGEGSQRTTLTASPIQQNGSKGAPTSCGQPGDPTRQKRARGEAHLGKKGLGGREGRGPFWSQKEVKPVFFRRQEVVKRHQLQSLGGCFVSGYKCMDKCLPYAH